MLDLPVVLLEHILASLSVSELARSAQACCTLRDCVPVVAKIIAKQQLNVELVPTRGSTTRLLQRLTCEVPRARHLISQLSLLQRPPLGIHVNVFDWNSIVGGAVSEAQ